MRLYELSSLENWFSGSKVVDKKQKPLRMYHVTNKEFEKFHPGSHFSTATAAKHRFNDLRFSTNRGNMNFRTIPVYLNIKKPLKVSDMAASDEATFEATLLNYLLRNDRYKRLKLDINLARKEGAYKALEAIGYDGLVYNNDMEDPGKNSWVIFHPDQVRFALLKEAIIAKPNDFKRYLEKNIKLLNEIILKYEQAKDFLVHASKNKEYDEADYVLNYLLRKHDLHVPDLYYVNLERHYNLDSIKNALDSVLKFGSNSFAKYVVSSLSYMNPLSDDVKKALNQMLHLQEDLKEYGFTDNTDPDYIRIQKLIKAFSVIYESILQIEKLTKHLKGVFADIEKRLTFYVDQHLYKPDHEEIETLYHTSIYASDIAQRGFLEKKPTGRIGLGNLGLGQNKISFTHDLQIAYDILKSMKDIWLIVHGKLTRQNIIKWINHEGLDLKSISNSLMTSKEPKDSILNTVYFYKSYTGHSKLRTNPGIVSTEELIQQMKTVKESDIGIISCSVKLSPEEEYLAGESEFRVPVSHIVGPIKRIA